MNEFSGSGLNMVVEAGDKTAHVALEINNDTTYKDEERAEPPAYPSPGMLYECEDVDCLWPCNHHDHYQKTRDFVWEYDKVTPSNDDCPYCLIFVGIGNNYCACRKGVERGTSGPSHQGEIAHARYDGSVCSNLILFSACGGVELEVGVARPPMDDQGNIGIEPYSQFV